MTPSATWRAVSRSLIGEPELTGPEVASRAGVDFEHARRLWRALGFAPVPDDERVFTRSDVEMLRGVRSLLDQQTAEPEVLLQLTRVTGQSLARVAEAQVAASAERFAVIRSAGASDEDAVEAIVSGIGSMVPTFEPFLGYVWRRHLLAAVFRFAAAGGDQPAAARRLAVGFADLVGFTAISQQLSEHELAAMVDRFEALAYEHIPERGGRVVKMIGDEVMFTVEDAVTAAEIGLALVEAHAGDQVLPEMRVGLAIGPTLSWEGDLFGPTVNLASRLVNIARPGTVLVSEDLGEMLQEAQAAFVLRHLRPVGLKGIGRVRVWVVRRAPTGSPDVHTTSSRRPLRMPAQPLSLGRPRRRPTLR
jgi:adenylate cyclase